jgi:hypothetical protein
VEITDFAQYHAPTLETDEATPPELRGRGYAGSVTAALVERIYAEGKSFACLYTDLRNPFFESVLRKSSIQTGLCVLALRGSEARHFVILCP